MKVIEYIGKILPDGHLSIPEEVKKELESYSFDTVRVTIAVDSINKRKGWEIFKQMGRNAEHGKLPNAAEDHDKYLYGKEKWEKFS